MNELKDCIVKFHPGTKSGLNQFIIWQDRRSDEIVTRYTRPDEQFL